MKELLLSEKYRPKTIDDLVLPDRIRNLFIDGILDRNIILYGHFGTGKTSLARILIGKYTKDKAFLELNSSKETSIDVIRTKVESFCSSIPMGFDLVGNNKNDIKYVFMDEYERMSQAAQDAMKVFVEEYSARNVRFILVTNYIGKISPGILSRFTKVNFDSESKEESNKVMISLVRKMVKIAEIENITIHIDDIKKIVLKNAPDMRASLIALDDFKLNGVINSSGNINSQARNQLFNITFNGTNFNDTYHFVMDTFGPTKIDSMISQFGSSLMDYAIQNKLDVEKLFEVFPIVCKYTKLLESQTDPIVIGVSFIGEVRKVFNI